MSRPRRTAVQRYHDRVAHRYDASYEDAFWQWHDRLTWEYLKPFLPCDLTATVLDLGCGTGKWAAKLVRSGYTVTCVDISPQMLDQARSKIGEQSGRGRTAFVRADLCDLGMLPEHGAALAIALGEPVGCARSPALAMKQIRRVLTTDGVLVATFDNRLAALDYYLEQGTPPTLAKFLRDGKMHWLTKGVDERFPITAFSPAEVRNLVEAAGFQVLEMVGKTVLPMRHHRDLLSNPADRRAWASIERRLCRDPAAMGRASHLQVACRVLG